MVNPAVIPAAWTVTPRAVPVRAVARPSRRSNTWVGRAIFAPIANRWTEAMPRSGFLSNTEVERFLNRHPAPLREIALELRNLVAAVAPQASERILWGGLSYFDANKGGPVKGGVCQIELQPDHVRLAFIHGAFLNDPSGLLEGKQRYKKYVALHSYDETPWEELEALIRASANFDPTSLSDAERNVSLRD
jgi:hypothetical protein